MIELRKSDPRLDELYISIELYYWSLFWHWLTGKWIDGDDLHDLRKHDQVHLI
jgi:hypothetical protein